MPIGTIIPYTANGSNPQGFLECNGAAISREMYPELFNTIGTTYGNGDGSTTFNLPDLRGRFIEGNTTAGTIKEAGLPNITGNTVAAYVSGASSGHTSGTEFHYNGSALKSIVYDNFTYTSGDSKSKFGVIDLDASLSNSIYGNSDTVQPPSLTLRYLIKAFDSAIVETGSVDYTRYAQDLANRVPKNENAIFNVKDVITTSGTYTFPITGLYKISIKGAGGGGQMGGYNSTSQNGFFASSGAGGGEGGTTIIYKKLNKGTIATIVIGAGGTGGNSSSRNGGTGGSSTITINGTTYIGDGGTGGNNSLGGHGGSGTIIGEEGTSAMFNSFDNNILNVDVLVQSAKGGGTRAIAYMNQNNAYKQYDNTGCGGCGGGVWQRNYYDGSTGGSGVCYIEYLDESLL